MFVNLFSFQQKMMFKRMMINKMKKGIIAFFAFIFSVSVACATEIPMGIAVLRGLDKVTGRISTFSIPVGEVGAFGKTFIVPEARYTHPPEESPENSVFLYVFEKSLKGENIELFKGWMFSSEPALSSMEHPVYDIWLIECRGAEGPAILNKLDTSKTSHKEHSEEPDAVPVEDVLVPKAEGDTGLAPSQVEMEEL